MRRFWSWLSAVLLVAGVLVMVPSAQSVAEAATPVKLKVAPAKPIRGESFTVTGTLGTKVVRPVVLQRKSGSKWKTVTTGSTRATGGFALTAATGKSSLNVRVTAPKVTISGRAYAQVISKKSKIKTVGQSIKLSLTKSAYVNQAVNAKLTIAPARSGRPTQIQVKRSGKWVTLATGFETSKGLSTIQLVGATAGTFYYRGYVAASNGAPAKATAQVKVTIKRDKTAIDPDARPLSTAEANKISSYDPTAGVLVLTKPPASAKTISTGDVIAVPPRKDAAAGALRTVTKVTSSGSTTTIRTADAALPDVVHNVPDDATDIGLSLVSSSFTPGDGVTVQSVPRKASNRVKGAGMTPASEGALELNVNIKTTSNAGFVELGGSLSIAPANDLRLDMDWGRLKGYKIGAGVQVDNKLTGKLGFTAGAKQTITLGKLTQVLVGWVGPVPVWLQSNLKVIAEFTESGTIAITTEVSQSGRTTAGITNTSNTDLTPKIYTSTATTKAAILAAEAAGKVTAFIGPSIEMSLYSAIGPYARLGVRAEAELVGSTANGFSCTIKYGPHAEAGLGASEALEKLTGRSFKVSAEVNLILATLNLCPRGGGPGPGTKLAITSTSLPGGVIGKPYTATLTATGGSAPYTWTATGLPAGITLTTNGTIAGTPTLAGTYSPTITVTDRAQATATITPTMIIGGGTADTTVAQVAASELHTCAVTATGAVKCWGYNASGQLGDGTTTDRSAPVQVAGLGSGVTSISAGASHTCAVTAAGAVKCWGPNWSGQLGDGTITDRRTPVQVVGLGSGVTSVFAGGSHTCAVTAAGAVKCWGYNTRGQLGDGTTTSRLAPVLVAGLDSGVTSIYAGMNHTCAVIATGAVKCWGINASGQLGDGTTTHRSTPVQVVGLDSGVTSLSASTGDYTCAVIATGAVKCWGYNGAGQLGDGTTTDRLAPVLVVGLDSGVTSISNGLNHTCATIAGGAVKCWGSGLLGDGTTADRSQPVEVVGLDSGVTSISTGGHSCAVIATGAVKCWGYNGAGQLGDGTTTSRSTPVQVVDLGG